MYFLNWFLATITIDSLLIFDKKSCNAGRNRNVNCVCINLFSLCWVMMSVQTFSPQSCSDIVQHYAHTNNGPGSSLLTSGLSSDRNTTENYTPPIQRGDLILLIIPLPLSIRLFVRCIGICSNSKILSCRSKNTLLIILNYLLHTGLYAIA